MNPLLLTIPELLNYASLHAKTSLEKALARTALDLHNEVEILKTQADKDREYSELMADGWNMVASSRHTGQPIDTERLAVALVKFGSSK